MFEMLDYEVCKFGICVVFVELLFIKISLDVNVF